MNYYDKISGGYDELHREEQVNKLKLIKSNIKIRKDSKLLDVGCGSGISSDFECFAVGIDTSMGLLKRNNKLMRVCGAAEALPFKGNSFDFVISVTAIHNFDDVNKSLEEILRVGKNNFVFSILKKSNKFNKIRKIINASFKVHNEMDEGKDIIFFCRRKHNLYIGKITTTQ